MQVQECTGIGPTHQQRFDRAIYLTYVETHSEHYHKRVTKEEFYRLFESKLNRVDEKEFDKSYIYRLADKKDTWRDVNGRELGVMYSEDYEGSHVESYWVSNY